MFALIKSILPNFELGSNDREMLKLQCHSRSNNGALIYCSTSNPYIQVNNNMKSKLCGKLSLQLSNNSKQQDKFNIFCRRYIDIQVVIGMGVRKYLKDDESTWVGQEDLIFDQGSV